MANPLQKARQQPATARGWDGFVRPDRAEEEINELCRRTLNSDDGNDLMDYIASITTGVVMTADTTDAQLRMQEGMRRLYSILDMRRKSKPKG